MYCSRNCCTQAIKNVTKLKEKNPDTEVYILYRDVRAYGMHEISYKEARNSGVIFINYNFEQKPEVTDENDKLKVKVFDLAVYGLNSMPKNWPASLNFL